MENSIYYLGLKGRTVQNTKFFKDKILIISDDNDSTMVFEKIHGFAIDYNLMINFVPVCNFYDEMIEKVVSQDSKATFMPYNQATVESIKNKDKVICTNDVDLVKSLNNKQMVRNVLSGVATCLEYKYLHGSEVTYKRIADEFGKKGAKFVVQALVGFAGIGTFVLSKDNENDIIKQLSKDDVYSVSEYIEDSISLNNTFMIGEKNIVIFEGSMQNIVHEEQLLYDGWDFESYNDLSADIKNKIYAQTLNIANKLQSLGYRGIGGVDYISKNNDLFFMEINPRFQASSEELDKVLQQKGYPSIFELQYDCFYRPETFDEFCKKYNK